MNPTIGVLGRFDADDLEAALAGRVLRQELRRRLPDAEIRLFAPYGWERPCRLDGGEPAEPLGPWTHEGAAELAARLDLAVVVAAPDGDDDRGRWLAPGALDEGVVAVEYVPPEPHLALLADALIPASVLEKRLAYLRLMGWWPDDGPVGLVEDDAGLSARSALAEMRLPAELGVEDVLAVVATADEATLRSPALVAVRRAYREPPDEDRARLDLWFEEVLAAFEKATSGRAEERAQAADRRIAELEARLAALDEAYEARGARLVEERLVFADHVDALQREFGVTHAEVEVARAEAERDRARAELEAQLRRRSEELRAAADAELTLVKATRSWVWTRPLRAVANRLGRRRR